MDTSTANNFRSRGRNGVGEALPGQGRHVVVVAGHLLFGQCIAEALVGAGFHVSLSMFDEQPQTLHTVAQADRPLVVVDLDTAGACEVAALVPLLIESGGHVVVLTSPASQVQAADCLTAGAAAAVDKRGAIAPLVRTLLDIDRHKPIRDPLVSELMRIRDRERRRLRPFAELTQAEQEVLAALMDGLSTAEIADERVVSTETVRTQVKAVLRKLGVASQLGAVASARAAGWTPLRQQPHQISEQPS